MGRVRALRIDRLTSPPAVLATATGTVLADRCHRATSALARAVGLLATPDLGRDEALWIERCRSVHTLGLRAAIGCVFVDGDGRVVRVVDPLPAWRIAGAPGARAVVECAAGVLAAVVPGDVLRLVARPHGSGPR